MKSKAIPFFAALGCTLTACGEKETEEIEDTNVDTEDTEDTDTEETDTEDTEVELGDVSALVGTWTIDSYSYEGYYGEVETTFPTESNDSYEGYGIIWMQDSSTSIFFDIDDTGSIALIVSESYTSTLSIDGTEIYNNSVGYSEVDEGFYASVREESGSYPMDLSGTELSCTLTGDALTCEGELTLNLSANGEVPEDFENISENYPATPEYTKEDCVDADITATGDALEWGGFDESAADDFELTCATSEGYFDWETYTYVEGELLEHTDDLVFSFTAPNDGCFAFNSIGTSITHGIQLVAACDSTEALSCSTTQRVEHGMVGGEEVLVVIDGEAGEDELFNLSINEIAFDTSSYDTLPDLEDITSIDTSAWTEEVQSDCSTIGAAKTYLWMASSTGTATFDLAGSDFDTVIQVQEATCGAEKFCNDDGEDLQSLLTMDVNEDVEYMITVGGYNGETGALVIGITIE